jgi:hypothetical protein
MYDAGIFLYLICGQAVIVPANILVGTNRKIVTGSGNRFEQNVASICVKERTARREREIQAKRKRLCIAGNDSVLIAKKHKGLQLRLVHHLHQYLLFLEKLVFIHVDDFICPAKGICRFNMKKDFI